MRKRTAFESEQPAKRQKLSHAEPADPAALQPIHNAKQLATLLHFHQDAIPQLRNGLRSVKAFLETIAYTEDKTAIATEHGILRDLLDSQRASDAEQNVFPSLLQAWSYAADTNSEALLSAIPAHFALLFRVISSDLKSREYGLRLGAVLLQESHAKLIARGLSAPPNKEHLISPCLRLLLEIVTFDGGSLAKQLSSNTARKYVLDPNILSRNISRWKQRPKDPEEARRKPSVRTNAVRYLLANLKFQSPSVRTDLLQNTVSRALFEHLAHDPIDILKDVFHVVRTFFLSERQIKPYSKAVILQERNLIHISTLLSLDPPESSESKSEDPRQLALGFLKFACTSPKAGLLKTSSWYPPGTDKSAVDTRSQSFDTELGVDSIEESPKYKTKVPIRNNALAALSQTLRPYANTLHSELLVDMFRAAPELVANYFLERTSFDFDPKLTATWVGYSAFLFSAVSLPIPENLSPNIDIPQVPPPTSIVIESLLPSPLTRTVLTRCLNQKTDLITFFAFRILAVAFKKLRACLETFRKAAEEAGPLWEGASRLLVAEFTSRCPTMKELVMAWKRTPKENALQREASLRLLKLCYQVTPQLALQDRFDVSSLLKEALSSLADSQSQQVDATDETSLGEAQPKKRLLALELNHIVQIAMASPDIRWFSASQPDKLSPCAYLLRILSCGATGATDELRGLLSEIFKSEGVLQSSTEIPAADALLASLQPNLDEQISVLEFLSDALDRLVKKPIRYQDNMEELAKGSKDTVLISLLWATLVEQWPFVAKEVKSPRTIAIAKWLRRYHFDSLAIGEDAETLGRILDLLKQSAGREHLSFFDDGHSKDIKAHQKVTSHLLLPPSTTAVAVESTSHQVPHFSIPKYVLPSPPPSSALHAWSNHPDIPTAIQAGTLPQLIGTLSSPFPEVRRQAYANLRTIHTRLLPLTTQSSTFADGKVFYLFLGELISTLAPCFPLQQSAFPPSNETVSDPTIPGIVISYASLAASILTQPLHPLYDKINTFHTRAPTWDASRLSAYWTRILLQTPASDDTSYAPGVNATAIAKRAEHEFFLHLIYDSLRRKEDVEISLRKRGIIEPLLGLCNDPSASERAREGVLKILWRVALLGESGTLVTRAGVLSWLAGEVDRAKERRDVEGIASEVGLRALGKYIWVAMGGRTGRWGTGRDDDVVWSETSMGSSMGDVELVDEGEHVDIVDE